jgi:hypothetical protein
MTNTDQANLKAVERILDKGYAPPKDRQTLTELIQLMEQQHQEIGQTIASAKKVLSLIVGGLK